MIERAKNCPVCGKEMVRVVLVCADCWIKAPAKDRVQFGTMLRNNQDIESKGRKIIRELRAKHPSPVPIPAGISFDP